MTDWQPYDEEGTLWSYDEAGWRGHVGYVGSTTAWGANVFTATAQTRVTRVEFWTVDAMERVDIALYDDFGNGPVGPPLWQSQGHRYDHAGYRSVPVNPPLAFEAGARVAAVVRFVARTTQKPVPIDTLSSQDSNSWISYGTGWTPYSDVGIRLRTSAALPDVAIVKTVSGSKVGPGDLITFTLAVANIGGGIASNVVVTDVMPAQVVETTVASLGDHRGGHRRLHVDGRTVGERAWRRDHNHGPAHRHPRCRRSLRKPRVHLRSAGRDASEQRQRRQGGIEKGLSAVDDPWSMTVTTVHHKAQDRRVATVSESGGGCPSSFLRSWCLRGCPLRALCRERGTR